MDLHCNLNEYLRTKCLIYDRRCFECEIKLISFLEEKPDNLVHRISISKRKWYCGDCYDRIFGGISVRTKDEQEEYMKKK